MSNFVMSSVRTQPPNPVSMETKGVFVWSNQSDARVYNATVFDSELDSVFYVYAGQALDVQVTPLGTQTTTRGCAKRC